MKRIVKKTALFLAIAMVLAFCFGCTKPADKPESTDEPSGATEAPATEYAPETTAYVAKVGGVPIYESEFYYFLYQGISEIYYQSDEVFDEDATDEDNLARMLEFFNSSDENGVTYKQKAVDLTLKSARGFKMAAKLGRDAAAADEKYKISDEQINEILKYVEDEAEYGAYMYGIDGDKYFFYTYGMNVNDAKRYSKEQLYAELSETVWADKNGWSIGAELPTEPEKPTEPTAPKEDAQDSEKADYEAKLSEYNTKLAEYQTAFAQYQKDIEEYEKKADAYWEKFRGIYDENPKDYNVNTVLYLQINKGENAEEAKAKAEKYLTYAANGESFESLVKGFSESETVSEDKGLVDVDPWNVESSYTIDTAVAAWTADQTGLTGKTELIETDDAFYIVKLVGITDFDGTNGITAAEDSVTGEVVRANVEYETLSKLYNDYVESFMDKEGFELTEVNNERMLSLADEYLTFTGEE